MPGRGNLEDRPPGGGAVHGLLEEEVAEIIAVCRDWDPDIAR
jgi:hypothetical protein